MGDPDEGREFTSIDVDELGTAVDDLDATLTGLTDHISGLETDFGYFGVDKSNLNKLLEAKKDLEDIMPDMRRRHSLAVQLLGEQQSAGLAGDGTISIEGTDILNDDFDSITDARNAGSDLADQVNDGNGEIPPEVYEELEKYGHDPDFAEAFINGLSPEARGLLLIDADNQAEGNGPDDPNEAPQLAVANVFSTASFRIDYDEAFLTEINQALLDRDPPLHPDGIRIVDRIARLSQHGQWDHESLGAFAEAALHGDRDKIGKVSSYADIYQGLAHTPRAAAEYMGKHPDDVWYMVEHGPPYAEEGWDAAMADFVESATVTADPIYARLGLYDDGQVNVAQQNAAFVIDKVGSLEEPGRFSDEMRSTFVDITDNYWDDFIYAFTSPAGVADNPDRDGIEIDPAKWDAFITEGMRSEEGAARTMDLFENQIGDTTSDRVGDYDEDDADTAHATGWDAYMNRRLGNMFVSNWEQVLGEREAAGQARDDFREGVIDFLVGAAFDPKGTLDTLTGLPKDVAQETVGNLLKDWTGSLTEEEIQELDTEFFGDRSTWMRYANELNDQGKLPRDPGYDDGTVTWDGDPAFYEEHYGGEFRDENGDIKPINEIRADPQALAAYNAWLQDPAVQLTNDPLFQPEVHSS